MGFCPIFGIWQDAGYRRLAKCDAGSFVGTSSISLAPPQAAGLVHSAAPPLKIAIALLDCDFVFFVHVGATWGFAALLRTHSQSGQKTAHSGDTRLTAANGARCGRVQGCKPFKALPPYPLAPASARAIGRCGAPKECRDFALRFSASALKCRAALQAQGLPRLVLAASETCAACLPSAWSLSAPPCAVQDVVNGRVAEALPLKAMLRMKFKCNGCALRCNAVLVLRDNAERIAAFQPPDDQNASG
mgnify:CR=1 FL=1